MSRPTASQDELLARSRALIEAVRLISESGHDLDAVLDALTEQARRLLGADSAALNLATEDGEFVVRRPNPLADAGAEVASLGATFSPGRLTREAIRTGRPLVCADFQADPRVPREYREQLPGVRTTVVVPLLAGDSIQGMLYLDWTRLRAVEPADLEVAEALGAHAGVAIRTARLVREVASARAEAELVLNATGDAVLVVAPDGRVLRRNAAAERLLARIFGAVPPELDLATLRSRGTPVERPDLVPTAIDRALAGSPASSETVYRLAEGEVRVNTHASPAFGPDGRVVYAVVALRDVTELHRGVADRARLEGAVKTARALAHEMNQHLGLVVGYADILASLPPTEAAEAAREMARAAQKIADVTARLHKIVRFEETGTPLGPMLDFDAATAGERR